MTLGQEGRDLISPAERIHRDLGHILNILHPTLLEGLLQQIAGFPPRMAESGGLGGAGELEFLSTFQHSQGREGENHDGSS